LPQLFGALLIYSGVLIIQDNSQTFSQILEAPNTIAIVSILSASNTRCSMRCWHQMREREREPIVFHVFLLIALKQERRRGTRRESIAWHIS